MRATIDSEGKITLGRDLQRQLGVQPGDDVLFEKNGDEWIIKAVRSESGLCFEGNILVHRGVLAAPIAESLAAARDERFEQLSEGLTR